MHFFARIFYAFQPIISQLSTEFWKWSIIEVYGRVAIFMQCKFSYNFMEVSLEVPISKVNAKRLIGDKRWAIHHIQGYQFDLKNIIQVRVSAYSIDY